MKALFKIVLLFLCVQVVNAQVPAGSPTINSPGWAKYSWLQGRMIFENTDTTFAPRFGGTTVYRPTDGRLYYYDSVTKKFLKLSIASDSFYVFSTGLTEINKVVTANLSTGMPNGQSVIGGTLAGDTLVIRSTTHATKGLIRYGATQSGFNELTGRWGIGTLSPSSPLSISSNQTNQNPLVVLYNTSVSDAARTNMQFFNSSGQVIDTDGAEISLYSANSTYSRNSFNFWLKEMGSLRFATTNLERLRVDSVGQVGINDSIPVYRLDIKGTVGIAKDSLPTISAIGSQFVMLLDTSTAKPQVKKILASNLGLGINNVNIGSGFRVLSNPSTQELRTISNSNTIQWDSTSTTNTLTAKVDTSVVATQYDLSQLATPALQAVTDAGHVTTNPIVADSVKARGIEATADMYLPVRNMLDSVTDMRKRGDLWYDSVSNTIYYRTRDINNVATWSPLASLANALIPNRPNMRIVAGVIRATLVGDTLRWGPVVDVKHDSIFFTGVHGNINNRITVSWPHVSKVIAFSAWPDETLAGLGVTMGSSVELDSASIIVYVDGGTMSGFLRGTGGVWVKSTNINQWQITDSVNRIWINYASGGLVNNFNADYNGLIATYTGTNGNYIINKIVGSPIGAYGASIQLTDAYGNPVTTKDAGDVITLKSNYRRYYTPSTLVNGTDGFSASLFANGFANIWFIGILEL